MSRTTQSKNIHQLTDQDREDFCRLIVMAFHADPLFLQLFPDTSDKYAYMQSFMAFMFDKARIYNEIFIGYSFDGGLRAAAIVQPPHTSSFGQHRLFAKSVIRLIRDLPFSTVYHLNSYMRFILSTQTRQPQHYLTMIGVEPASQGQGIGKALLLNLLDRVDKSSKSTGIGLDTENPANVEWYKHFGFELTQTKKLMGLDIYCMFRSQTTNK